MSIPNDKARPAEIMTPRQAMETAIKVIGAYKGEAIERAVYGAIGAATALERIGLLSMDDGADWCAAARKAGEAQQIKIRRKGEKSQRGGSR